MRTRQQTVDIFVRVYREEEGQWTAESDLGISSCGDTVEDALESVKDALLVYIDTAIDEGQLDRVLRESGSASRARRHRFAIEPDVLITRFRPPIRELASA